MTVLHWNPSLLWVSSTPAFWKYPHRWRGGVSRIDDCKWTIWECPPDTRLHNASVCGVVDRCLVGGNVGTCVCVCVCDRQEGLSSRIHVQQQQFLQHCWQKDELNQKACLSIYTLFVYLWVDEGWGSIVFFKIRLSNLIRFSFHHLQTSNIINN